MTTEYVLEPGQSHEELARDLLEQAASPNQVTWSPRPDVFGGGVYVLADEGIAQRVREVRAARREEQAKQIADAQAAANERDASADVAAGLLTPAEAGFSANAGTDPGSAAEAARNAENTGDADDAEDEEEAAEEATETPAEEEKPLTPAQKRAAAKKAKQEEAAQAADAEAADQEKSE
jgi:hypothetical protein